MDNKFKFKDITEFSKEYLKQNFWKCNYTSAEEKYHYWIILPNNVNAIQIEKKVNKDLNITEIGSYIRVDDSPFLDINVAFEHIDYEINASDWLRKKLYLMGETIIEENKIQDKSCGIYLDALTESTTYGGDRIISRFTTIKDSDPDKKGANYFLVKVSCLEEEYNQLADTICHISLSWNLKNIPNWQLGEALIPFKYPFVEPIEFYIPVSWEGKFSTENNLNFSVFNFEHKVEDKNTGDLTIFFYELSLLKSVEKVYEKSINRLKNIENYKLDISPIQQIEKEGINNKISEIYTSAGNMWSSSGDFEAFIHIFIIKTLKGWYYIESIGSQPNIINYNWEINKRCIEIIVETFNNTQFSKGKKVKEVGKKINNNFFKIFNDKKYTKEEWKEYEKQQWEEYEKRKNKQ